MLNALRLLVLYKNATEFFLKEDDGSLFSSLVNVCLHAQHSDFVQLVSKKIETREKIFMLRILANCFYQAKMRLELFQSQERVLYVISEVRITEATTN